MHEFKTPFESTFDRREFTARTVLALLSGVAITVSACGGDDDGSPTGPSPPPGANATGTVSANHGHQAEIAGAALTAGNAVALDIRGQADHPHTVELSAAEVMQVAGGQRVSKSSSTEDLHAHTVTFNA